MPGHRDSTRTNSRRGDLPVAQTESSLNVNPKDRDATCVCCTATLAADSPCTSCDVCSKWQCIDCSKMSIAQYKLLKGLENFTWICNICKPSLKSIKQLSDKMDEFTSAQSEMSATLANMKATITVAVKDELAAIRPSLNRQIADEVQNQLSSSVRNTEVTNATDIQKMIRENLAEAREIEKRRLNLMVYRLNESADAGTGTQYDIDLVRKVLSDTDIITNASITRAERIGKPDRSKTRPLRITVQDQASRLQILRNAQKVKDSANFKEIAIAPDRTPAQRDSRRAMVQEMKARAAAGEQNLVIHNNRITTRPFRDNAAAGANQPFREQ